MSGSVLDQNQNGFIVDRSDSAFSRLQVVLINPDKSSLVRAICLSANQLKKSTDPLDPTIQVMFEANPNPIKEWRINNLLKKIGSSAACVPLSSDITVPLLQQNGLAEAEHDIRVDVKELLARKLITKEMAEFAERFMSMRTIDASNLTLPTSTPAPVAALGK